MTQLYFASSNQYKVSEYVRIFSQQTITITPVDYDTAELQSLDPDEIVRDKVARAYATLRRPVIVEHCGLSLSAMGGLPMGLTKPFWSILKDHICQIANNLNNTAADMVVCMAFCDGKNKYVVKESVAGNINKVPVNGVFHLDRVFVPSGAQVALAGMSDNERDKWSPRSKAALSLINVRLSSFIKNPRI